MVVKMDKDYSDHKKSRYKSTVPAVSQALQLLNNLAESADKPLTLTEICKRLDIPKSKGYTLLNTLSQYNFIEKNDQTKTYKLGLGIVYIARSVLNNLDIREIATPHLRDLAENTGVTAHLGQLNGSRFYIIAREENRKIYGYSMRVGDNHHITHGSHGKAIVAFLPDDERKRILSEDYLCFYGDGEPVDFKLLNKELDDCRKNGFAIDPGDTNPNINAISSPIFDIGDNIIGGVVLVGAFDSTKFETFGPLVVETSLNISRQLGYRGKITG